MNHLFNYESQLFAEFFKSSNTLKNTKKVNFMKSIKNLLTVALIGLVTLANANNNPFEVPTANFKETKNEKIRLTLLKSENAKLKIEDALGVIIYDESITSENTVAKEYDLTTLADGMYIFSVELSDKIIEQEVSVEEGNITLKNANIISKPVFFETENELFVTIEGLSESAVEVRIFDNSGNEYYQSEKENLNRFNTKYDMSKLKKDTYTVAVIVDGKTYYKIMELK